jgi:hypothetical protein
MFVGPTVSPGFAPLIAQARAFVIPTVGSSRMSTLRDSHARIAATHGDPTPFQHRVQSSTRLIARGFSNPSQVFAVQRLLGD